MVGPKRTLSDKENLSPSPVSKKATIGPSHLFLGDANPTSAPLKKKAKLPPSASLQHEDAIIDLTGSDDDVADLDDTEEEVSALSQHVQSLTWACLTCTPMYASRNIKQVVTTEQDLLSFFDTASSIEYAPGLEALLDSDSPPQVSQLKAIDFDGSNTGKIWAVYAIILEAVGLPPLIYVGSGMNAVEGVRSRLRTYDNQTLLAKYMRIAIKKDGYAISHRILLCPTPIPKTTDRPVVRALLLALEAMFTFKLWSIRDGHTAMHSYAAGPVWSWDVNAREYKGLNTHNPLNEVSSEDLSLTRAELVASAAIARARFLEMRRARSRRVTAKRAKDPARLKVHQDKKLAIARKAKSGHFCDTCKLGFPNPAALTLHCTSKMHDKLIRANGKYVCGGCEVPLVSQESLEAHRHKAGTLGECPPRGRQPRELPDD